MPKKQQMTFKTNKLINKQTNKTEMQKIMTSAKLSA